MDIKQALLREYIGEDFPKSYQSILVFSDEKARVEDHYGQIPIVCGGGVSKKIREFNTGNNLLTEEQITNIKQAITSHHKIQKTPSPVNCDEIINDYAVLMASIEEASTKAATSLREDDPKFEHGRPDIHPSKADSTKWIERIDWRKAGKCLMCVAPAILPMIVCGLSHFRKH